MGKIIEDFGQGLRMKHRYRIPVEEVRGTDRLPMPE